LLAPPSPTFTGTGPSKGAGVLGIGTALIGGVQTGINAYTTLNAYTTPKKT
jgi:hypothetical protein